MLRTAVFALALTLAGTAVPVMAAAPSPAATSQSANVQTPVEVVKSIANELADALEGHRKELKADKDKLIKVIDGILLPHFDIDYASILVLGRHAREATPAQRERFARAFYNSITHRYAEGLLDYTRGAVKVLPMRGQLNPRRTVVRTTVQLDNGKDVSIDYAFRQTSDGQWKVYDVIVEGISYITNYRNQVDVAIRKEGLEALIGHLESQGGKALDEMKKESGGA
ncbi:MAG TPA: ABC transporter substrate-binding protein [Oleiagrimonas sp.]|nr:ABC transporter substrate-binding protein [Oleiagrimonas sp.]